MFPISKEEHSKYGYSKTSVHLYQNWKAKYVLFCLISRIPAASWDGIMHDLMKKYSATVDCSSEKGVNNYADGALALAGNRAAGIHESVNSYITI